MKKIKFFAAALGLLTFAACSNSDDVFTGSEDLAQEALQDNAITFGTYMGSAAQTKAGTPGAIAAPDGLKSVAAGFGVFAYYTGNDTYETKNGKANTLYPNFMYNEQVTWNGSTSAWEYSPLKYWPNDFANSAVDGQSPAATGSDTYGGNVSFFAYAPWVTAGSGEDGIIAITNNNTLGDPKITYVVAQDQNNLVDLLWGTYNSTSPNVLGSGNAGVAANYNSTVTAPIADRNTQGWQQDILWIAADSYRMNADLNKQKTQGKVGFAFKHALAKVGGADASANATTSGFMIVADFDGTAGAITGGTQDANCKITVKEINIVARSIYNDGGTDKYMKNAKGDLNLATGKWEIYTTSNLTDDVTSAASKTAASKTTYSIQNSELNTNIKDGGEVAFGSQPTGVTTTPQNIYAAAEAKPLVFIPGTKPELEVTIEYYVTYDADGVSGINRIPQKIKKTIAFTNPVELNKQYSLLMHLGFTSVKFDATVSTWDEVGTVSGSTPTGLVDGATIHLPINVKD